MSRTNTHPIDRAVRKLMAADEAARLRAAEREIAKLREDRRKAHDAQIASQIPVWPG